MLKTRISAILHAISATFLLLLTVLGASFSHAKFVSPWEPRVLIPIGLAGVAVETYAAVGQWRTPALRRSYSIVLHFLFAASVLTAVTFEYVKAPPAQLGAWFEANNFFFILLFAAARIVIGTWLISTRPSNL